MLFRIGDRARILVMYERLWELWDYCGYTYLIMRREPIISRNCCVTTRRSSGDLIKRKAWRLLKEGVTDAHCITPLDYTMSGKIILSVDTSW